MHEEKIARLIQEIPGVRRKVEDSSRLVEDLGFDSLKMVELMGEIEDEFDLIITLDDAISIRTVADLKKTVGAALDQKEREHVAT